MARGTWSGPSERCPAISTWSRPESAPRCRSHRATRSPGARTGRLDAQRRFVGPPRVPRGAPDEDHGDRPVDEPAQRRGTGLGQRLDRARDDPSSREQRLPRGQGGDVDGVGLGRSPAEVEGEGPAPAVAERRDAGRRAGDVLRLADVDEPDPRVERARDRGGEVAVVRVGVMGDPGEAGVDGVVAEQVCRHAVGHPEPPGEEGTLRVLDPDQAVADERPGRGEPRAGVRGQARRPGQLEGQPDRGAAPGDVVVEVAVEPLEAAVEVREERDEEQVDVEVGQPRIGGHPPEPDRPPPLLGPVGVRLDLAQAGRDGGGDGVPTLEEALDDLVADVQPPERVVRGRVSRAAVGDELTDPVLDDPEPAQDVGRRGVGARRGHGPDVRRRRCIAGRAAARSSPGRPGIRRPAGGPQPKRRKRAPSSRRGFSCCLLPFGVPGARPVPCKVDRITRVCVYLSELLGIGAPPARSREDHP